MAESDEITLILEALRGGERDAFGRLISVVYQQLRLIARGRLRRVHGWSLDTTGLVHEAYVKMSKQASWSVRDRNEFLAASSVAMKQVLIELARRRVAAKRGGGNSTGDSR